LAEDEQARQEQDDEARAQQGSPAREQSGAEGQEQAERELAETDEPAAAAMARADADEIAAEPTTEVADEGPQLDPSVLPLLERLEAELGDAIVERAESYGTLVVRVRPDAWKRSAEVARTKLSCDYLSFVSGIDWQPAPREGGDAGGDTSSPVQPVETTYGVAGSEGRLQVFAHVQSTAHHWGLTFKTDVDDSDPRAQSWVEVYPGADWHERECWEMYGVRFDGHPSLRHLYLPAEFEGHPLRKDFPLLARVVKPWPGLVDVEGMPEDGPAEVGGAEPAAVEAGGDEA
jgi:NADH-quinone oxidoreductase subunit C